MTQDELENRLKSKILEAFALLLEYDRDCKELSIHIVKNSVNSYLIKAHNDAYKHEVKPLLMFKFADDNELKFKSAEIDDLICSEAVMYAYDKAAKQINNAAFEVTGKDQDELQKRQIELVKLTLDTQREQLKKQLKEVSI